MARSSPPLAVAVAAACLLVAAPPARAHPGQPDHPRAIETAIAPGVPTPTLAPPAPGEPVPARARAPGAPAVLARASTPRSLSFASLALLVPLALFALGDRRWRRAVPLGLVAMLAILAFETGLHSVHHLGDTDRRATCAIVTATSELSGLVVGPVPLDVVAVERPQPIAPGSADRAPDRPLSPIQERAPPLPAV